MPDISQQYDSKHQKQIEAIARRIKKIYEAAIIDIAFVASTIPPREGKFALSLFPLLEKEIEKQVRKMHGDLYSTIISGVKDSWNLSNSKNDLIVDRRLADKRPSKRARQILYDPNGAARDAFISRKERGMDLSKRVWKLMKPFKHELEQGIGIAVKEGVSAHAMATELKKNLNEPDKLFRRVRGEDGKLSLSAAARNYHPGQGVYRSSYKNALRLARSENNMAYQNADYHRWQQLPFVVGIEVVLSRAHPRFDQCDFLKGRYPRDFKFTSWHPQCLCTARPIMMTDEEYSKYEDQILGIGKIDMRTVSNVRSIPQSAQHWIADNRERIEGWKNKPYFIRQNPKYIEKIK